REGEVDRLTRDSEPIPDDAPPAYDLASLDWERVDPGLRQAIDDLKPEFQQVLLLWSVHGMKYRQIAAMLEVPIGTVMSRLFRARKHLADALGGPDGTLSKLGVRVASAGEMEGT